MRQFREGYLVQHEVIASGQQGHQEAKEKIMVATSQAGKTTCVLVQKLVPEATAVRRKQPAANISGQMAQLQE